jgi:transglutaminase-like putative cysteine protease
MTDLRGDLRRGLAALLASLSASTLLFSTVHGREWFLRAAGLATLVGVIGIAGRAARLPRPTVILVQLLVGYLYLTAAYASADARRGFIPTRDSSITLRHMVTKAWDQLPSLEPPFIPKPEVSLLAVALVGVITVMVDALAAGYRQPALAGMPLLGLYVLAGAMTQRISPWLFLSPALAFLILLTTDNRDRLLKWGVAIGGRSEAGAGTRGAGQMARMSRQIGVAVLSLSVAVPAVIPRLTRESPQGLLGTTEGKTITTQDPLVSLRRDLRQPADIDLLTMRTTSQHPSEQYLRSVTLDVFDGTTWSAGRRTVSKFTDLPAPLGLSPSVDTTPVDTEVTAEKSLRSDYLPMTFPATKVSVSDGWRLDELTVNVVSHEGQKQISGLHWTVQSLDVAPTEKDVVDTPATGDYLTKYLQLPTDIPALVKDDAERVTKGAQNPLQVGAALQEWFRRPGNFTYDLSAAPGSGNSALIDFLRDRHGYCEQFAATMAVMARQLGIPARVDVGFTAGRLADDGLTRIISAHDAHAWPELWIPNLGWTRFEPTPGSANSHPSAPSWLPALGKGVQPPDDNNQQNNDQQNTQPQDATAGAGGDQGRGDGGGAQPQPITVACDPGTHYDQKTQLCADDLAVWWKRWWKWELLGVALLLLLAAPALVRELIRRRRWLIAGRSKSGSEVAEIAWRELGDDAVDLRIAWPTARTPRRTLAEVGAEARLTAEGLAALNLLSAAVERSRYAREGLAGVDPNRMRTAVLVVAAQLGVRAGRWRRFIAVVAPASVWVTIGGGLGRFGQAAAARRARLRPRGAKA